MPLDAITIRADYADALISARRAKGWLVAILLIIFLGQIAIFFCARKWLPEGSTSATTQPIANAGNIEKLRYVVGLFDVVGLLSSILLSIVLLLIVNTMLVGRLVGVGKLTSAFILSLVLLVLVFPWQALLSNPAINGIPAPGDFKFSGILYTWAELIHPNLGAKFPGDKLDVAVLRWARYVGFPIVAVIILLVVHLRSARGLRMAMGGDITAPAGESTSSSTPVV